MKKLFNLVAGLVGMCMLLSLGVAYTDIKMLILHKIKSNNYMTALGVIENVTNSGKKQWINGSFCVRGERYKFSGRNIGTTYNIRDEILVTYNKYTPSENYIEGTKMQIKDIISEIAIGIGGLATIISIFRTKRQK